MKTRGVILATISLFFVSLILQVGCNKDEEESENGSSITDSRDGKTYETAKIGDQTWMAENLNYETSNSTCYADNMNSCSTYGRLYTWDDAKDACPSGWHLPSDEEWKQLEGEADSQYDYPHNEWNGSGVNGYDVGVALKTTTEWLMDSTNATNSTKFSALPGGSYYDGQWTGFTGFGTSAKFWTSTADDVDEAWSRALGSSYAGISRKAEPKASKHSVRCVKD